MTIEFKILEDYKKESHERAVRLQAYQTAETEARSKLSVLTTQYELVFTDAIKNGKDETDKLAKIDAKITEEKEKVERLRRDRQLAHAAMPTGTISPVEVVENFAEFTKEVQAKHVPGIEERLKLARDLVVSVLQDARELDSEYAGVTDEVKVIAKSNHEKGLTRYWMSVGHPTTNATILRQQGATSAVRKVFEDVSKFTYGTTPHDFEYVTKAPTTKEEK